MVKSRQKNIFHRFRSPVWRQRVDLFVGLVDREMKLMYNRSTLGIAWTLIKPLMQLLVFALVFGSVLSVEVPQYASFIFCGLISWVWFQSSLSKSTASIIQNGALIRQPSFPVAILPIVTVATGLIHYLLSLPILLIFLRVQSVPLNGMICLLPLIILLQAAFTVSFAYVLAAVNVVFRDTQHTLDVLLQMLFYLTGIFYQVSSLPEPYRSLLELNPMLIIINAYRSVLLGGAPPNWLALGIVTGVTVGLLPIGYNIFQRQSIRFVEEL